MTNFNDIMKEYTKGNIQIDHKFLIILMELLSLVA